MNKKNIVVSDNVLRGLNMSKATRERRTIFRHFFGFYSTSLFSAKQTIWFLVYFYNKPFNFFAISEKSS